MEPKIIYEDENFMVLDKPSGWIVNQAQTTASNPVIQNWLIKSFDYPLSKSREFRSGIVHRLDKETSGLLLVAKTSASFKNLQLQFKSREVHKVYTALVHGRVEPGGGVINAPVGRLPWNRERFGVIPGGRNAETAYRVVAYYKREVANYTLLELFPKTGRTHQIRIHLKYLGHPIVGDETYAGRKTAKSDRLWSPRLFLHASEIEFKHPVTGKKLNFTSQFPKDLVSVIDKLGKTS